VTGHFESKSMRHFGFIFNAYFFFYYQHVLENNGCICYIKHESGDAGVKGRLGGVV